MLTIPSIQICFLTSPFMTVCCLVFSRRHLQLWAYKGVYLCERRRRRSEGVNYSNLDYTIPEIFLRNSPFIR